MQETMTNAGVTAKHFAALSTNAKGVSAFGIDKENHDWILGFGKFWRIARALLCIMPSSPFVLFVFNVGWWALFLWCAIGTPLLCCLISRIGWKCMLVLTPWTSIS
jgi:Phosphoglucose isomerase